MSKIKKRLKNFIIYDPRSFKNLEKENSNLRAKLETAEKIRDQARNCYKNMQATNEKLRNDLKVERDVLSEQFDIEENLRKERDSLSAKIGELEKYAELGRLAIKLDALTCGIGMVEANNPCCSKRCTSFIFCHKRAELIASDHHA